MPILYVEDHPVGTQLTVDAIVTLGVEYDDKWWQGAEWFDAGWITPADVYVFVVGATGTASPLARNYGPDGDGAAETGKANVEIGAYAEAWIVNYDGALRIA